MSIGLLDERTASTWPSYLNFMALCAELVGEVADVACYATRQGQVVGADK
jgi:hypothetical protein